MTLFINFAMIVFGAILLISVFSTPGVQIAGAALGGVFLGLGIYGVIYD